MGIGHVAVALGASRAAPRLNVGWLVFAALLADFLLGIFAALGLEHSTVPPDLAAKHYLLFTFPYSHGLVALGLWSVIFGFLISRGFGLEESAFGGWWRWSQFLTLYWMGSYTSPGCRCWGKTLRSSGWDCGGTWTWSFCWRR